MARRKNGGEPTENKPHYEIYIWRYDARLLGW